MNVKLCANCNVLVRRSSSSLKNLLIKSSIHVKQLHITSHRMCESQVKVAADPIPNTSKRERSLVSKSMKQLRILGSLSKFRLSSLVVLTSGAGYVAALPLLAVVDYSGMLAACIGTGLCAASASTFNQVIEVDRDRVMRRTQARPLPAKQISPEMASLWGAGTGVAGLGLLLAGTNPTTAALGLLNIGLYAGAYTYSKPHTELNTWIGSLVGAVPPVMGWAAATGGSMSELLSPTCVSLSLLLYLWQFPHFFALSFLHRDDYRRGGFQMVAVNDPLGLRSAELILEYSFYLTVLPLACTALGLTSAMFAVEGCLVNGYLLYLGRAFHRDRTGHNARRIFLTSLWYLPVLMAGLLFHSQLGDDLDLPQQESGMWQSVRAFLKERCVHEILVSSDVSQPQLCARAVVDKAVQSADRGGGQLLESVKTAAAQDPSADNKKEL